MQGFRIDVSSLLEELGATLHEDAAWPLEGLSVGDQEFLARGPASFSIDLTNTGTGIVASGSVTAPFTATCSRCLEPFPLTIEGDVEAFYVRPGHEEGIPEEQETVPIAPDETIDIAPALIAALAVEAPFAPVHDESCAGLCPICGCNLNIEHCDCHPEQSSLGQLAGLKELLDREDD